MNGALMAEQAQVDHAHVDNDYPAHERTYEGFIRFFIGGALHIILTLVCLLGMSYIGGFAFWVGLIGLLVGSAVVIMTLVAGLTWMPMLVTLLAVIVFTIVGL